MKEKNLKSQFLLAISFLIVGCKYEIKGDTVAFIYPSENRANVRTFSNSCPVKVSEPTTVSLAELEGWICVPADQAAKHRREFEKQCN